MNKYIKLGIVASFILLILFAVTQCNRGNRNYDKYIKELQNVEAYKASNSGLEEEIKVFKMSLSDLKSSNDSLDKKLVSTMRELKLADNSIKNMQYQLSNAVRTDTIVVTDTIFNTNVNIDTTIGDEWYNIKLKLEYPSTIITTPTLNSEQYIYVYNKKEYIGGKSKCFFINWFKKKYISTEVKIEEKNPYIILTKQKFIEIDDAK